MQETWVRSLGWEDSLEKREWQLTPGFFPREFHGQRRLAGCSPQGCKESDRTEQLTLTYLKQKGAESCNMFVLIDSYPLNTQKPKDLLFNINFTHKISVKKMRTCLVMKTIARPPTLTRNF